jgi:hypothetical protein
MGWKDAPLVGAAAGSAPGGKAAWESAPLVGAPATTPERGVGEKIIGGAETALSTLTGIPATVAGQAYGIGRNVFGPNFGTQQGIQEAEKAAQQVAGKLTYQPRTPAGKEMLQTLGQRFEESKLAGLPIEGPMLRRLPEVPAVAQAAGEAVSGTAGAGARAAGRTALRALPEIDAETTQLARQAHAMGFRLQPHEVYGNKYGKFAGEAVGQIPLAGADPKHNQNVFNQRLVNLVGGEGDKLTRKTYGAAMDKWGSAIGDVAARTPVPIGMKEMGDLRGHAAGEIPAVASVVNHYADMVEKALGPQRRLLGGGTTSEARVLPGPMFRKIYTDLDKRIRGTADADLRGALSRFQEEFLDLREPYMSEADRQLYDTARRHYAIGKTLEPLIAKAPTGNVPPSALLGVLNATAAGKSRVARGAAGELGTLADIGQRFLKEPASSGTGERRFVQGLLGGVAGLGGAAAYSAPAIAVPGVATLYGGANLYNRLGPSLTEQLISRPPR